MHRWSARALVLFVALVLGLSACSGSSGGVELASDTVIIDVRTPAEYAEGHLEGAVNVDLQSGSFEQEVAALPLEGDYVVYCRSGNRSAQAVSAMKALGFVNVQDAGGLQAASSATGLSIVA